MIRAICILVLLFCALLLWMRRSSSIVYHDRGLSIMRLSKQRSGIRIAHGRGYIEDSLDTQWRFRDEELNRNNDARLSQYERKRDDQASQRLPYAVSSGRVIGSWH